MTGRDILSHVDHTILSPTATWEAVVTVCDEAEAYRTASVCIPPCYVEAVHLVYPKLEVCTVVGFPLGYQTTAVKVAEATEAVAKGATEIDMVINITHVKNEQYDAILQDIYSVCEAVQDKAIVKVIIETCYLTEEEIINVCECVSRSGAAYIKTSTGFGTAGATLEHVRLMKEHIEPHVKIKAAGGIRTIEDMKAYLELGVDRLGSSAAVGLLKERLDEMV